MHCHTCRDVGVIASGFAQGPTVPCPECQSVEAKEIVNLRRLKALWKKVAKHMKGRLFTRTAELQTMMDGYDRDQKEINRLTGELNRLTRHQSGMIEAIQVLPSTVAIRGLEFRVLFRDESHSRSVQLHHDKVETLMAQIAVALPGEYVGQVERAYWDKIFMAYFNYLGFCDQMGVESHMLEVWWPEYAKYGEVLTEEDK